MTLWGAEESEIHLHWSVGGAFNVASILDRAELACLRQLEFRVVGLEDAALLCCWRAVGEDLQTEHLCHDLIALKYYTSHILTENRLVRLGAAGEMTVPLLALATILNSYDPQPETLNALRARAAAGELRTSAKLAELLVAQLRGTNGSGGHEYARPR